jgi:hypothetical protein
MQTGRQERQLAAPPRPMQLPGPAGTLQRQIRAGFAPTNVSDVVGSSQVPVSSHVGINKSSFAHTHNLTITYLQDKPNAIVGSSVFQPPPGAGPTV